MMSFQSMRELMFHIWKYVLNMAPDFSSKKGRKRKIQQNDKTI
jgi:hypothetical protein